MNFTRKCPKCDIVLQYVNKRNLCRSIKNKSTCLSCAMNNVETKRKLSEANKGKKLSKEHCKKLSKSHKGNTHSEEIKQKIGEAQIGKILSEEIKQKISKNHAKYWLGKTHSEETKQKMRLIAITNIEKKGSVRPNYNLEACRFIEEYGLKHGYNFQHAENGGEFHIKGLGYWVDGYDEKKNTVIEYDEPAHYQNGELKEKDVRRQQEIEEYLGCEFIRIKGIIKEELGL